MSDNALLPCFVCGGVLENVCPDVQNQPYAGTTFWTPGHYGSTFFDSFDDQELVLNICDSCLRVRTDRLAVQTQSPGSDGTLVRYGSH